MSQTQSQHDFVVNHYAPRASAYVTSAVHSGGADLDQIEAFVRGASEARVLDLGCGGGHVSYRAAPHVREVVACDLTPDMLTEVSRTAAERGLANIAVQQAPAERLPFADGSFDIVLCRFTTHHWHDAEAGLREARRVLKPAGRALFSDIVSPGHPLLDTHLQTVELLRDPSHVRNYSAAEWIAKLMAAGFSAQSLTPRKLRMEFGVWTARTKVPEDFASVIRQLQVKASAAVRQHFGITPDGSFDLDSLTIEAVPATL
ncbi:class I SAM-dependent methyltransferase [Lichenihabitans psoromatis]|uniref:class I SAM-dependent methyltransferase n=1 Tax=Lichenihabitans psoromatis TaxID=2528642 RepID=UPI0010384C6C|nr:class I SAM-dependent methyltransferase [Lichenihabitans psoromatis]